MKISGKFILKVAGTLTVISLITAFLLGLVNGVTKDKIAAIDAEKTRVAMSAVVPEGSEFTDALDLTDDVVAAAKAQGGTITELYGVTNGGAEAGYVAKVSASGSQGTITMMVGIDANKAITGISVVSHSETSGIGTKVVENKPNAAGTPVLDQFIGMSGAGSLVVGSNITAVSGATVSTKGITMGANAALAAVEALGYERRSCNMNFGKQFKEGLITQNPVLVQLLGMCSTMAITTSFFNGLGMGVSVLIILTLSNIFIALLRKIIPNEVRIACFIVVIAGFVTCVDLLLKAFVPALSNSLGVFIPLIVVNCIILGRAEAFASKNTVGASTVDGICQGIGYTIVLIIMCVFRELLGSGKFGGGLLGGGGLGSAPGITIFPEEFGIKLLTLPVGGFLTLGALIALMQWALAKSEKKKEAK